MKKSAIYLTFFCAFAALGTAGQQKPTLNETQEANLKAYIDLMRQDLRSSKVSILGELMGLDPQQAARFWPVYNDYDKGLTKLADERLALIRRYVDNYSALTDDTATRVAMGLLDIESRRVDLRKQYFQRFSTVLTPRDAARWLQIEVQIERLIDLQILASLPIVETPKETTRK